MHRVVLGRNDLYGIPFPLVLADRFFYMYPVGAGHTGLDVFRWDEDFGPVYEVRDGQPLMENITTNPTGIITFGAEKTNEFLFKFRPKPGVSQIMGRVPLDAEVDVHITDHSVRTVCDQTMLFELCNASITGYFIGFQIYADGSIAIGSNDLPEGMRLVRSDSTLV